MVSTADFDSASLSSSLSMTAFFIMENVAQLAERLLVAQVCADSNSVILPSVSVV